MKHWRAAMNTASLQLTEMSDLSSIKADRQLIRLTLSAFYCLSESFQPLLEDIKCIGSHNCFCQGLDTQTESIVLLHDKQMLDSILVSCKSSLPY